MSPDGPRFIVDVNVGRLAKWLRALGYDTLFIKDVDDDTLVRIGLGEGRVVLTRDSGIMERRVVTQGPLQAILIKHEEVLEQLRQVVEALALDYLNGRFSLCIECNEPLEPVARDALRSQVPPYVFKTQSSFYRCPACSKIYWRGSHWRRMMKELERVAETRSARA